jgi:hypothetical protein
VELDEKLRAAAANDRWGVIADRASLEDDATTCLMIDGELDIVMLLCRFDVDCLVE